MEDDGVTREADAPPVRDEPDSRQSLQHILSTSNTVSDEAQDTQDVAQEEPGTDDPSKPTIWIQEPGKDKDNADEEKSVQSDSYSRAADVNPSYTMTVVHSRRNANGTIGSVYSGNKIRHLKKEDGIPLWRKDIQYSFLRAVFENEDKVFTIDVDGTKGHTFADIYISAMARSSKTSKVLREKLLSDRDSALNMAMICLLVNVGRMNTTLNFFPEMRAQLRTYHSIPCLQVHQDANSQYKGLQDAPRLKSILKGSCEDPNQPTSVEKIMAAPIPRTNPVNLIFVLSQYAPKISETHFFQPRDFFDLVIRGTLSSKSRAQAFLWLVWYYLESDFSEHDALNNPFGPGIPGDEPESAPIKVPAFEHLTEEQANAENVDTEEEQAYGEKMAGVRKRILDEDETVGPPVKKPAGRLGESLDDKIGNSPARSDLDRTRSPSPTNMPVLKMPKPRKLASARDNDTLAGYDQEIKPFPRVTLKAAKQDRVDSSSPAPQMGTTPHARRARPETSHQRAVNLNRRMRIESILHKKLAITQTEIRRQKRKEKVNKNFLMMKRIIDLPEDYDSEDEPSWGFGGLVPNRDEEIEDYGGEALQQRKIFDRALRRLGREEARKDPTSVFSLEYHAMQKKWKEQQREQPAGQEDRYKPTPQTRMKRGGRRAKGGNGTGGEGQEEALDDIDMDLLGEGRGPEEYSNDESGMDDTDAGDDATEDGMVE